MKNTNLLGVGIGIGVLAFGWGCSLRLFEHYDPQASAPRRGQEEGVVPRPSAVARHREEVRERDEARAEEARPAQPEFAQAAPAPPPAPSTPEPSPVVPMPEKAPPAAPYAVLPAPTPPEPEPSPAPEPAQAEVAYAAPVPAPAPEPAKPQPPLPPRSKNNGSLVEVASFDEQQATGIAVSKKGRVFVCFPRWETPYVMGMAEILDNDTARGYPDAEWNQFARDPQSPPTGDHFISIQSLYIDDKDRLWVLDSASPSMAGVVRGGGGPKLIQIDMATNQVSLVIRFDEKAAPDQSYFNDVRIDTAAEYAFISDSGLGAIVAVDLRTGVARRLLEDNPSTKADQSVIPVVEGRELRRPGHDGVPGEVPQVHCDGIALDTKGGYLYWQALTGKHMYRIDTRFLKSPTALPYQLSDAVEDLGETVVADGMEADRLGNVYMAALEENGIAARTRRGELRHLISDDRLIWPDSLAIGPAGPVVAGQSSGGGKWLYFTTSQINRGPAFNADTQVHQGPFQVWRMRISE